MKITTLTTIATFILGVVVPLRSNAQDVEFYNVNKSEFLTQTSTAAPTVDSFGFGTNVVRTSGGSLISASITLPAGSMNPSPQALGSDGNGSFAFASSNSPTQAGLDAQFNNGTYGFNITGGSGSYSASLVLTGNAYVTPPPTITNTNWSGGELVIDPAQDFTLTWSPFSNFSADDLLGLQDDSGTFNFSYITNTTSQFFATGSFAPNTSYVFTLVFENAVDTNTFSIPGAPGKASYIANTSFTVRTGPPIITSPLVATGTIGLPFTYQFTAIGATSLGASNLPSGLTFNTSLRAISGIPTATGTFQVGLTATNSLGTTNATLTITVQAVPAGLAIVSSTCATGRTGRAFSFQLQTRGGSSATRYAVDNLPPGFNLDPATGFISGTSASDGSFSLAVAAIDGAATTNATLQLTFTSDPTVPVITSANSAILTPGQFFTYTITADANGTFGYIGTDGIVHQGPSNAGLPPNLSFDGINKISGIFIGGPINGVSTDAADRNRRLPDGTNLAGGIVSNVQLFSANPPNGTGILPLISFLEPSGAGNIATRLAVGTGENVLIGGFIIEGNAPKKVVIRAIGPSLTQFGVPNALADPVLDLNAQAGPLFLNDNWRDNQEQANQIIATQLQPTDDREAAILAYLNPGQYTAVVRGKNNTTGNALAEVYDLGTARLADTSNSRLANIATRGTVLGGDSVMIGGFIIRRVDTRVLIRAIGPSLSNFGISGALPDPTVALKNANGVTLIGNDDWQQGQPVEIQQTGLAPTDPRESALITTLPEGPYTAIVSGKGGATGVALVEVYALQ
jgi:hypothetical protein